MKRKNFLIVILLTSITINVLACKSKKETIMEIIIIKNKESVLQVDSIAHSQKKYSKPYHSIYVRGAKCQYSIWIDDILIFNFRGEKDDGGPSGDLPINNVLLKSGIHTVTARIYPSYNEKSLDFMSEVQLNYNLREVENIKEVEQGLFIVNASDVASLSNADKGLEGMPYFGVSRRFYAEVPFEQTGWSQSVDLRAYAEDSLKREIRLAYEKIHHLMETKELESLRKMYLSLMDLRAVSFYLDQEEKEAEWDYISKLVTNSNYRLSPLPQKAFLHFYAGGKLITLLDKDYNGIIRFENRQDPRNVIILDFKFHKKKYDKEFEVI